MTLKACCLAAFNGTAPLCAKCQDETRVNQAATHYQQVALDARIAKDHPLGHDGLPAFTPTEIRELTTRFPGLPDARTSALRDHRDAEEQLDSAIKHEPSEWHPCGACRAEANPRAEFIGPLHGKENNGD